MAELAGLTENGDERARERLDGFPHDPTNRRQDPVSAPPRRLSAQELRQAELVAAHAELNALMERTGTMIVAELRMRLGPNGGPIYTNHFELVSR